MINRKILLVEDNPDDIELTILAFEQSKLQNEIVVVRDGQEALDYLFCTGSYSTRDINDPPAIVLLDLNLPKIKGLQILKAIRTNPHTQLIPVIVLTSSKMEKDLIQSYLGGANSYIQKPVVLADFFAAINALGVFWLLVNEMPPKT
jgi:two-component system, response regulator